MSRKDGPCLCGAPDCESCGPAQGYSRCEEHGRMACEECRECAWCHEVEPIPEGEDLCAGCRSALSEDREDAS